MEAVLEAERWERRFVNRKRTSKGSAMVSWLLLAGQVESEEMMFCVDRTAWSEVNAFLPWYGI
jgi:hypothetical protein